MTDVNRTAPPAPPALEETTDPPTIKNAGQLPPHYGGGMDVASILVIVAMFAVLVASMVLAVMTSHGRHAQGLLLYGVAGLASVALVALAILRMGVGYGFLGEMAIVAVPLGLGWLVLGVIAVVVGSTVRPTGKRPDVSAF